MNGLPSISFGLLRSRYDNMIALSTLHGGFTRFDVRFPRRFHQIRPATSAMTPIRTATPIPILAPVPRPPEFTCSETMGLVVVAAVVFTVGMSESL